MSLFASLNLIANAADERDYLLCVGDLIQNPVLLQMRNYNQHGNIDCLEHSISVSFASFLICRRLGLDERSAARGGLLHDFFLYDWKQEKPYEGMHAFAHPKVALRNAQEHFLINDTEKDIILYHMWPLCAKVPSTREAFIVTIVDKYCAVAELINCMNRNVINRLQSVAFA